MFGVSFGELVIVAVVGLVLFGPERLPELARGLGKFMVKFNQTLESVQQEFQKGMESVESAAGAALDVSDPGVSGEGATPAGVSAGGVAAGGASAAALDHDSLSQEPSCGRSTV